MYSIKYHIKKNCFTFQLVLFKNERDENEKLKVSIFNLYKCFGKEVAN
jgi:hypothetical protein